MDRSVTRMEPTPHVKCPFAAQLHLRRAASPFDKMFP